ncbi:MAG: chemotaxis protein CheB [Desulfobacterales bacterium]
MEEKFDVLVIDDASFMVKAVSEILESDSDINVVGTAKDGLEGLGKIKQLRPDVITLDIDMPVMDGIKAIRHIMIESPLPIVVLSSLFADGSITFEALRLGVVDFVPKPSGAISQDIYTAKKQIIDRIKIATSVNLENIRRVRMPQWDLKEGLADRYGFQPLDYIIALGTSLSGPNTFIRLLSNLSPRLPATAVIVQEISPKILSSFVKKFDEHVPWKVEMARDDIVLEQGVCYISSNENSLSIQMNKSGKPCLKVGDGESMPLDLLFSSAAEIFKQNTVGVLLTGIGDDGADGFARIKEKSGVTIAQSTDTCVYPNLTQNVIERGTVDIVADENKLCAEIEAVME